MLVRADPAGTYLDELERYSTAQGLTMSFTNVAEAREYRESQAILRHRETSAAQRAARSAPLAATGVA